MGLAGGEDRSIFATMVRTAQVRKKTWLNAHGMHRADMIELLVEQLPEDVIHCGYRGSTLGMKSATVIFENGEKLRPALSSPPTAFIQSSVHLSIRHRRPYSMAP